MFVTLVLSILFLIDRLDGLQWQQLAPSDLPNGPVGRSSPSNVLYRDSLVMYGGTNHCGDVRPTYNDVWSFNLTTLTWAELKTENGPLMGRWGHFAWIDRLFDEDSMLVFGGRYGEDYDSQPPFFDVWRLNLKTLVWSKLNDGIAESTYMVDNNAAVSTANGKLYFVNSNRATPGKSVSTEIWLYEVQQNRFSPVPISPTSLVPPQEWLFTVAPLEFISTASVNGHLQSLVVYGGWQENQFYRFNLDTGLFTDLAAIGPSPPKSAGHLALTVRAVTEEPMYMIWSAKNEPELWFYSFSERIWTSMNISSPAPTPRLYTQIVPISNSGSISILTEIVWFVVGGHDINSHACLSDVWVLGNF